jgi:hypothetical protein
VGLEGALDSPHWWAWWEGGVFADTSRRVPSWKCSAEAGCGFLTGAKDDADDASDASEDASDKKSDSVSDPLSSSSLKLSEESLEPVQID